MKKVLLPVIAILVGCVPLMAQAQTKTARGPNLSELTAPNTNRNSGDAPGSAEAQKQKTGAGDSTTAASASTVTASKTSVTPSATTPAPAPTSIYRVGVGDVLDIQLLNAPTRESTLYTVLPGGLLEYPLAGETLKVDGWTTDDIDAALTGKIKIYDKPEVVVSVREFVSHNVIVTGLVNDPGTKVLRRDAVPLYVVLADAQPRTEAARATIMRAGTSGTTVDLSDAAAMSALVYPGDVIRLSAAPPPKPLYFYIGGQISAPGQKDFHQGMTLTQAIFASGGVTRFAGHKAKVMRQGEDGRLQTTEYDVKKITEGKIPDPPLLAGDRIEISRGGW